MVCAATCVSAQEAAQPPAPDDTRTQYPAFMKDSYFSLKIGWIGYLFTSTQLEPGFVAESIDRPRPAVRLDFFGHRFAKHLSAQVTYMRPAQFVEYNNVNGTKGSNAVSNAYAGVTLVTDWALSPKVSMYLEGGYGITSRSGFQIEGRTALQPAHYGAGLVGGGLSFHTTPTIDFVLGATYSPGRQSFNQPSTRMYAAGIQYNMRALPEDTVAANKDAGFLFPENVVRVGYSTNALSYGVNDLFSKYVVIFWGGHVETRQGFTIEYERNVFHTKKRFAFDLGASASIWESSESKDSFKTISAYPLVKFFLVRAENVDGYFSYSIAGPTFISQTILDGLNTGANFTFQDSMGFGAFIGKSRKLNLDISIKHFSNGNLATINPGIKVPLTFKLGFVF